MRIVHVGSEGRKPSAEGYPPVRGSGPSAASIFIGDVTTQTVVGEALGRELRMIEVHFAGGARNKRHTHTTEQILIVTEGTGIVAAGSEEREVRPGDVAFIPAGEVHWHGAKPGHDMTHYAINGATSKTDVVE